MQLFIQIILFFALISGILAALPIQQSAQSPPIRSKGSPLTNSRSNLKSSSNGTKNGKTKLPSKLKNMENEEEKANKEELEKLIEKQKKELLKAKLDYARVQQKLENQARNKEWQNKMAGNLANLQADFGKMNRQRMNRMESSALFDQLILRAGGNVELKKKYEQIKMEYGQAGRKGEAKLAAIKAELRGEIKEKAEKMGSEFGELNRELYIKIEIVTHPNSEGHNSGFIGNALEAMAILEYSGHFELAKHFPSIIEQFSYLNGEPESFPKAEKIFDELENIEKIGKEMDKNGIGWQTKFGIPVQWREMVKEFEYELAKITSAIQKFAMAQN